MATSKKPLGFANVVFFIFFALKKMKKNEKYENIDKLWISIHKSTSILFLICFPTLRNPDCRRNPVPIFILATKYCVFAHFRSDSRISVLFVLDINSPSIKKSGKLWTFRYISAANTKFYKLLVPTACMLFSSLAFKNVRNLFCVTSFENYF